MTVTSIKKNRK